MVDFVIPFEEEKVSKCKGLVAEVCREKSALGTVSKNLVGWLKGM